MKLCWKLMCKITWRGEGERKGACKLQGGEAARGDREPEERKQGGERKGICGKLNIQKITNWKKIQNRKTNWI